MGDGIRNILGTSKQFEYSVINCVHRVAIELLKIDGFAVDPAAIERTGEHSMSFQTSLILLEESLIRGDLQPVAGQQDRDRRRKVKGNGQDAESVPALDQPGRSMHGITNQNRQYWFELIKLYEIIGNQDALHGIWC